uniref:Transposase n=1 Tax=Steinernema glaseri TaxID=37863 RepID=A0A1I7Y3W2_9BILA
MQIPSHSSDLSPNASSVFKIGPRAFLFWAHWLPTRVETHDRPGLLAATMTMIQNPIDILQTLKRKIPAEEFDENWILHLDDDSTRKKSTHSQSQREHFLFLAVWVPRGNVCS